MPPLPPQMAVFAPAFSRPTFVRALVLLCGTLLASGRRRGTRIAYKGRFRDRGPRTGGRLVPPDRPAQHRVPPGVLFGLFSIVAGHPRTGVAHALHPDHLPARAAAWYAKDEPTFADAPAAVCRALRAASNSRAQADPIDSPLSPRDSLASLMAPAAYAA